MKTSFFVESTGKQAEEKALIAMIKENWVAEGNKIKDIKDLAMYANTDEQKCYYIINESVEGCIDLF